MNQTNNDNCVLCAGERDVEAEVEERCVSLVSSLFTNLGPKGGRRERLGAKFVENEFEKADRLLEIYSRCAVVVVCIADSDRQTEYTTLITVFLVKFTRIHVDLT